MNRSFDDEVLVGGDVEGEPKAEDEHSAAPPTIFCLQEIDYTFTSELHAFFAQRGYHFVTGLYGKKFNGYMGVGIAYPLNDFDTVKVDICRLSDERDGGWPRPPVEDDEKTAFVSKGGGEPASANDETTSNTDAKDETKENNDATNTEFADAKANQNRFKRVIQKFTERLEKFTAHTVQSSSAFVRNHINKHLGTEFRMVLGLPPMPQKQIDPWDMSENRFNVLLTVVLRLRGNDNGLFSISNYHMPCAFYCPPVMNIHSEMVARRVQTLAANVCDKEQEGSTIPHILAGDFNILPDSPHYQLLTTGTLDKTDPSYPPPKYGETWKVGALPMDSAYALKSGEEPEFTNFAHIKEDEDPFIGTLDYIFLSQKERTKSTIWKVHNVQSLPEREASRGPFPNEVEPSDHMLIAADLELLSS